MKFVRQARLKVVSQVISDSGASGVNETFAMKQKEQPPGLV